jgi:hypothetical protein
MSTQVPPSRLDSTKDFSSLVPSAFAKANAAYAQANAAFAQANTGGGGSSTDAYARDTANAGFITANSAALFANGAFIQANAAYNAANNASDTWVRTQANNSYDTANSAGLYANGAFTAANTADTKATSAGLYANGSFTQSNAAFEAANSASLYANAAFAAANSGGGGGGGSDTWAREQANAAFITANSASTYANTPYISSGTSNVSMTTSGGNIYMNVGGVNIVNVSTTWANVTGNIAATQGVYSAVVNTTSIYATSNIITANIRTTGSAGNISGANYVTSNFFIGDGSALTSLKPNTHMTIALSDETTSITTGVAKITFRAPFAMTLTQIPRASLSIVSSSGNPAVDNKNGTSIFSTTLTIDANEKTSTTAATAAVLSTTTFADDDEITMDIDTAGTGAKGLKVTLYYRRT